MQQSNSGPANIAATETGELGDRRDSLKMMVEAVTDYAVFMLDPNGIVTSWNTTAERLFGYSAQEIVGRSNRLFYPVDSGALNEQELEAALTNARHDIEDWRVRGDGSLFWAGTTTTVLRGSDNALIGFGKTIRDLTERDRIAQEMRATDQMRIQAEMDLSTSNAVLNNILNASIFTSIIGTDLQGTITTFNKGAELMLGYDAAEIVGKHTPMLFHVAEEVKQRGLAIGKLVNHPVQGFEVFKLASDLPEFSKADWTYIHKDKHEIAVSLSLGSVYADDGSLIGFVGVAQDVTEKRAAERALNDTLGQLDSILESTSDSVITVDFEWNIVYGNARAAAALEDFRLGSNYWECFPSVRGTPSEKLLRQAMINRTEVSYETFYQPYQQWFNIRIFPSQLGITAFFQNVTEEKKIQEQLSTEQLLREKRIEGLSHMAGGLAHEISNPLAIIHGLANNLLSAAAGDEAVTPEQVRIACASIIDTSDRAMRVLRGLRGFAREGENDPSEWVSMYDIIDQCVELQQARFERHHVRLMVELQPTLPLLLCREIQISQIITNLLNNAFDAIQQSQSTERWVKLVGSSTDETITIDVIDSGPGIDEKFRPHLMSPFFTMKTGGLGMGIGLSLSKNMAQDHGGSLILCEDLQPTCFRLVLPIDLDKALVKPALPSEGIGGAALCEEDLTWD